MRLINAEDLDAILDFPSLIDALAGAFSGGFAAPARHHHALGGDPPATHLVMPAWTTGAEPSFLGDKIVNVFPGNGQRALPAVFGLYVLQSGETGEPLAAIDGTRLTHWRTAAASALAARFLARADARRLLMVGAGALAPFLVRAHCAVRAIDEVAIWSRTRASAQKVAAALAGEGLRVAVADDLEAAARRADVISCATLSPSPLIAGDWLAPGQHLDLVGAFNRHMREADDEALRRARVFVDTEAALSEGGDVALAIDSGALDRDAVKADLAALCAGAPGRTGAREITLFKSVGAAIEDLAAAILVWRAISDR